MCTGLEILAVVGGLAAAGSAVGAVSQGMAAQAQADTQAKIQAQQAAYERQASAAEEKEFRERQSRLQAARRALLGGSGVDPSTGTPLLASEDLAGEIELQALKIRQGGEVTATRLEQQARLNRMAGQSALTSGFFRGGSLLLQGAGTAYQGFVDG